MFKIKSILWLTPLLTASLACALSGLSAPGSNSALDSNSLSTSVAGTANAAAMQTKQANPSTSTPLPTSTKTATPTPIVTPSPQVSTEGTSLVKQSDGSYVFTDYQGSYSIMVPSVWLAVRLNEQEFINAPLEVSDPTVQDVLSELQNFDPKIYRLMGLDTSPGDLGDGFVTTLSVYWDRSDTNTIEQEIAKMKANPSKVLSGVKITYADIGTTSTHLPIGIVEQSGMAMTKSQHHVTNYQKAIIYKPKSGVLTITLSTLIQLKDKFVPGFDLMTDQIKMLP
jgi:hypothetical protein